MIRAFWLLLIFTSSLAFGFGKGVPTYKDFISSCGQPHSGGSVNVYNELDPDAAKVALIFEAKCQSCHNPGNLQGNVSILDVDQMWTINPVLQGGTDSKLYKSLNRTAGWMPLGGAPLSIEEKNAILFWQTKNGLANKPPPLVDDNPPVGLPYVPYDQLVQCIFIDILKQNVNDRPFTRYLELSNLSNNGKQLEFNRLQQAVIKTLNSISNQSPLKMKGLIRMSDENFRRAKSGIVDEYGIILRFDTRDIGIDDPKFFDDQFLVVGQYPYALDRDDFELGDKVQAFEDAIFAETDSDFPFIRADFFVHDGFQPPIYHNLLDNVNLSAATKDDLLALLGVDQTEQFDDEEAKRSGLRFSNVATFSRVIDHFEVDSGFPFQFKGQLVTSYDFDDNLAEKNPFGFPFGPDGLFVNTGIGDLLITDKVFIHQAEEWIYTNGANGTSLYAIFNGDGIRQDVVPLNIAQDPLNIGVKKDFGVVSPNGNNGEIVNGVSCAGCHAAGMLLYTDTLRDQILYTPAGFNSEEKIFAKENFFEQADLRNTLLDYITIFTSSQDVIGVSNNVSQNTEQVYRSAQYYQGLVDICELSAELLLSCEEGRRRMAADPVLSIDLGYGPNVDGFANRDTIEAEFGRIAESFFVGEQILFADGLQCILKADKQVVFQGDKVRFVIEVIGDADIIKINGIPVKNNILLQLNKLGINIIEGFVANKEDQFVCKAQVLVKKKAIVKPTCSVNLNKLFYYKNEYITAGLTYTGSPTKFKIQGNTYNGQGKFKILANKVGKNFRVHGYVENGGGSNTCEKFVDILEPQGYAPTCTLASNKSEYWENETFRINIAHKNNPTSIFIAHFDASKGYIDIKGKVPGSFRFIGSVKNQYGKNECQKIIKIKKKLGVKPTCSISSNKTWINQYDTIKLDLKAKDAVVIQIDGKNVKAGSVSATINKLGKHTFHGYVKNQYGESSCYYEVDVRKNPPCVTQVINRSLWYSRFDLKNDRTGKRVFDELRRIDVLKGYKIDFPSSFTYLGEFWDGRAGKWFKKEYQLDRCTNYKLVTYDGVQVLWREDQK